MNENRHHFGLPSFAISVDLSSDHPVLTSGVMPHRGRGHKAVDIDFFTAETSPMSGDEMLRHLIDSLFDDGFGGVFVGSDAESAEFDIGALVGRPGLHILKRGGVRVSVEAADGTVVDLDGESVVVMEALLGVAALLASVSKDEALVADWIENLSRCIVLPWHPDSYFETPDFVVAKEAAHYASMLGQSVEYYEGAALWLLSRQYLFGMKKLDAEPTQAEYALSAILDIPSPEEIDGLADEARKFDGRSLEKFRIDATSERNIWARQELLYGRWYRSEAQGDASAPRIRS